MIIHSMKKEIVPRLAHMLYAGKITYWNYLSGNNIYEIYDQNNHE